MTYTDAPATARRRRENEFAAERHVYEPHRIGLPPLVPYVREAWRRRQFAYELARSTIRAQHLQTFFGQMWLLLNPLLLSVVYFILVDILRHGNRPPHYFVHLMACLFLFNFFSTTVTMAAKSVVKGGKLILNTAFPRSLLPLSSVLIGLRRFIPTLGIYAVVHVASGLPIGPHLLWAFPVAALLTLFTAGVAMLVSAAQVYFRDVSSFLPYLMRIWMYGSPVLYFYNEVPEHFRWLIDSNPLTPIMASWSDILYSGVAPSAGMMLWSAAWAAAAVAVGGLFFVSREREFAVRL
jgi:teichoic acid transport system permease protein